MALRLPGFGRRSDQADEADYDDLEYQGYDDVPAEPLTPNRMRGREPLETAAVAAVLAVVGLLNLLITTGSGAAKHPTLWMSWVGIVLAVVVAATISLRNRLVCAFLAIIGAFFVTTAKAPTSLSTPHFVALIAALGYALVLSMRQRRDQKALMPAGASRGRRRRGDPQPEPPTGNRPSASRRYTPPKSQTSAKKSGRTTRR